MPKCSNPVQCQTAKRTECTCDCGGLNHGRLRVYLDSTDPGEVKRGEEMLADLKSEQEVAKKASRIARRQRRAAERKAAKNE